MKKNNKLNLGAIVGALGVVAGLVLAFSGDAITGGFGACASALVLYISLKDHKEESAAK